MTDRNDQLVGEGVMQTISVAPPDERTTPRTQDRDEQLDAELDQTMDASDPPSATQPGGGEAADEAEAHPS